MEYLQRLLKGGYHVVCGGMLEPSGPQLPMASLPFSIRENLRSYVRAVLDADADSPPHHRCLGWLSHLSLLVGNARDPSSTSKYSRAEHRRFLRYLLGHCSSGDSLPDNQFQTLATGVAMIALTALANGANISLVCVTNDGQRISLPQGYRRTTREIPLSVMLWLTEPPEEIAKTMNVARTFHTFPTEIGNYIRFRFTGGNAEISRLMARRLPCSSLPTEECLLLWKEGMALAQHVTWSVILDTANSEIKFRLSDSSIHTEHSAFLEPLAKKWCSGPRFDIRHDLARKAAEAFHNVYQYRDYENIDEQRADTSINLVLTGFAVGCLKKLFSDTPSRLSFYAMVFEEEENPVRLLFTYTFSKLGTFLQALIEILRIAILSS